MNTGMLIRKAERMHASEKPARRIRLTVLIAVLLIVMLQVLPCAAESFFSDGITRIRNYSTGKLLYDASYLEPRCGPGERFPADYSFNLKEGAQVRVLTFAYDEAGNQWAMVEGNGKSGPMRVYLLYYDIKSRQRNISISDPGKLAVESSPDYNRDGCMLDPNCKFRTGPGNEYTPLITRYTYGYNPAIVAVNNGWVLVEYEEDEMITESPMKYRGWVPIDAVIAY